MRRPPIADNARRNKLRLGLAIAAVAAVSGAVAPFAIGGSSDGSASAAQLHGGAPHSKVGRHAPTHQTAAVKSPTHDVQACTTSSSAQPTTLWKKSDTPAVAGSRMSDPAVLGVNVVPSKSGTITGVGFWKGSGNTGTHTASLWSAGKQLASGHFTQETATGWQWMSFAKPVTVKAGQNLVAAYRAPHGHFAYTPNAFSRAGVCSGSLRATSGFEWFPGARAQTATDHTSPADQGSANYFVDVRFVPTGAVTTPTQQPTSHPTVAPSAPAPSVKPSVAPTKKASSTSPPTTKASQKPTSSPTSKTTSSSAWPDATNTGVPAGTKLTSSGGITVTADNTKIDAKDISGPVVIEAKNVTITRSKIHSGGDFDVNVQSGNVTISDSELYDASQEAIGFNDWKGYRLNVHGMGGDGVKFGDNVTLEDSYFHDFTPAAGAHADGGQAQSGVSNLVIQHNNIDPANGGDLGNSAVFLKNDLGGNSSGPITVNDNLLGGGNYTLYAVPGNGGSQSGVTITNNQFKHDGQYGPIDIGIPITSWSGNIWSDTKAVVSK